MAPHIKVNAPLVALIAAASLALTAPAALAQGGPPPGKGGGGGGHTTTATTNLSYPAVFTGTAVIVNGLEGQYTLGGPLGETWSYGCSIPEEEFPNSSCIDPATGLFMDYDACVLACPGGVVERMYWQKESPVAVWQAESLAIDDVPYGSETWTATHVDWGDNLESQTWTTTSVIRVETTTFTTLPLDTAGAQVTLLGFQLWHVSGKGPDEMWGLHATEPTAGQPAPYVYNSPYAIIHAPTAEIGFTKLEAGVATCPSAENPTASSPPSGFVWNEATDQWGTKDAAGNFTPAGCVWKDLAYSMELNIGGKFVHGYNWQTSRMVLPTNCVNYKKDGWWRLTYHNVTGAVVFTEGAALAPPTLPVGPAPAQLITSEEEEGDTGPLYIPVVDAVNNLTYIDICLKPGRGGGGRR